MDERVAALADLLDEHERAALDLDELRPLARLEALDRLDRNVGGALAELGRRRGELLGLLDPGGREEGHGDAMRASDKLLHGFAAQGASQGAQRSRSEETPCDEVVLSTQ